MHPAPARDPRRLRAFRAVLGLVPAVAAVGFVAPLDPTATRIVSDATAAASGLALLVGLGWARRHSRGPDRLAWSVLLWTTLAAFVIYALDPVDPGRDHFPIAFRVAPAFTLAHTGALLVATRSIVRSVGVARLAVDAVWLALGVVLVIGGGGPIGLPDGLVWSTRVGLVAQQFNAAVLVAVLGLLLHATRRSDRGTVVRLAGPIVLMAASQAIAGFVFVNGELRYGGPADFFFSLAFVGAALAATEAVGRRAPRPRPLAPGAGQLVVTWAPLAVWGVVAVVTHASVHDHEGWVELLVLVVGAVRLSYLATENTTLARRLHARAVRDPLTGLPNRRAIEALLQDSDGAEASLLLVDLDRFKAVNDTLGHSAGDELLRVVGARMRSASGPEWTVARLAGDEFVIVTTRNGDLDDARSLADQVVDFVSRPILLDGREVWVGASVGVAVTARELDASELLDLADHALRAAKKEAKGEVVIADERLRTQARNRGSLERDLRRAIDQKELRTLYQPKVDLASGALVGVEALVRWERPGHGVLPPSEFIALAESTGLIARIDSWVLATAVEDLRRWNEGRGGRPRLALSTNMSAWQLARTDVDQEVRRVLAGGGVDPAQLTIELTETLLVEDPEVVARRLQKLRATGVGIAIDDFGAGFTSISYLREFPVTEVKIDRGLVWELVGDERDDASLVGAVIALSHALALDVIAEGVETPAQAATLRRLGCRVAQGYLFSPPVDADHIGVWAAQDRPFDMASFRGVGPG